VLKELDEMREPEASVVSDIRARAARRLAAAPDHHSS
jgi:hypothetical protein